MPLTREYFIFSKLLKSGFSGKGRCGKCNGSVSIFNSRCPKCGVAIDSSSWGMNALISVILTMFLAPLFNLPAFIPAAFIMFLFVSAFGSGSVSPFVLIIIMVAVLVGFTYLFWKLLALARHGIEQLQGPARKVALGALYVYVFGCYLAPGVWLVGSAGRGESLTCRVIVGAIIFLCGLGTYTKKVALRPEGEG